MTSFWVLTFSPRPHHVDLRMHECQIDIFWTYSYAGWAKRYLDRWFLWATYSCLDPMRDFVGMLKPHQDDLMNYSRMPILTRMALWE